MIDADGYRPNVGIIIANNEGQVLWARRIGQDAWQFPQGGINDCESPKQALYRELEEEVGLKQENARIVACTRGWLRYKLPQRLLKHQSSSFVGQKQKWYLMKLLSDDDAICVTANPVPEFDQWRWVSYWYPLGEVVSFKQDVYRQAMKELAPGLARCTAQPNGR